MIELPAGLLVPFILWCVWWLAAVNWQKVWPVLAQGGWAPLLLLMTLATLTWSRVVPADWGGAVTVPNGWWQALVVCGLVAVALFCGWLQGRFGWAVPEINVEPPPPSHDDHGHH